MTPTSSTVEGVVHGRTIELDQETGIPDGTRVQVAVSTTVEHVPGEGIRKAFGAWAQDAAELDAFLEQVRRDRHSDHREILE